MQSEPSREGSLLQATADARPGSVSGPPRCGDAVLHRPTGERWLVAWADPSTDDLAWAGWPDGRARLSDCEVVRRCTDEQHAKAVAEWRQAAVRNGDGRRARVLRMYGDVA